MSAPWQGRSVLVTGHTGFKGSWLSLWLERLGARVTGYALAPATNPSLYEQAEVGRGLRSVIADIRDPQALAAAVAAAQPEVVFHLAAQPLVRVSYVEPTDTFATNVMGTVHLLDALSRVPSVRAVVVITTDKVYENLEQQRVFREADELGGHDPYSASKACAEIVCRSWRRSFGPRLPWRLATARAGNVLGGGDWAADRLVPDLVRGALSGRPTLIRNPAAIRPWQHVLDPLAGYLALAESLLAGADTAEAWNFGPTPEDQCSVAQLADLVVRAWGPDCAWGNDLAPQPHESGILLLDSTRARQQLRWRTRLDLPATVEWTVRWYRDVARGASARELCLRQIAAYEELPTGNERIALSAQR